MQERIPTVQKGEPITADAWNRIVSKLNEQPQAPFEQNGVKLKGEFWLKNAASTAIPAFALVYVSGFATSWATDDAALSALASDRVVLNAALTGNASQAFAQTLEPIQPGKVGRAALTKGAGIFAFVAGSNSISAGTRVKLNARTFAVNDEGEFKIVAADVATRFVLLEFAPLAGASYTAGTGININDGVIGANTSFCWGAPKTSGSGYDTTTTQTMGYNDGSAPNLYFSNQFKRVVDSNGLKFAALRTQSVQVVTDVVDGVATKSTIIVPLYANNG